MLKRIAVFFIIFVLLAQTFAFADELSADAIIGETAVLLDYNTGEVIWNKKMNQKMFPASTTKILTAIIILENHDFDEVVTVPNQLPSMPPNSSHIAIDYGEVLTVEQLMYAMMVKSANDAANVLAIYHSGSIEAFAAEMNKKAAEIGAVNSHFVNPNGLHDNDHYTTAYDLALIAQYAFQNSTFRELVKTTSYVIPPTNKKDTAREYIRNGNKFLTGNSSDRINYRGQSIRIKYDIVDGIKTGYTTEAGNCLVTTASKGNVRYIVVVMKSNLNSNVYKDSRTLLDYGFENFYTTTVVSRGSFIRSEELNDTGLHINLVAGSDLTLTLDKNIQAEDIQSDILVDKNLTTPIEAGTEVGSIVYYHANKKIGEVPLLTEYAVTDSSLLQTVQSGFIKLDENNQLDVKYYIGAFFKLLLSFIIYRTIITTYNLRKRKKRLLAKEASTAIAVEEDIRSN